MATEATAAGLPSNDVYPAPADVDVPAVAKAFLLKLEEAAQRGDGDAFAALFIPDGYWRDVLAFTRDFRTIDGSAIASTASVRSPTNRTDGRKRSRKTRRAGSPSRRRRRPPSRARSRT